MRRLHHNHGTGPQPTATPWSAFVGAPHAGCIPALNQLLADTIMLRDLYRKHRWQVTGDRYYPRSLLFETHCLEQCALVDRIAERIRALGGAPAVMPHDVAGLTRIACPPVGRETPAKQIARLLRAHDIILTLSHDTADLSRRGGDQVTSALIAHEVIRLGEIHVWRLVEHMAGGPLLEIGA